MKFRCSYSLNIIKKSNRQKKKKNLDHEIDHTLEAYTYTLSYNIFLIQILLHDIYLRFKHHLTSEIFLSPYPVRQMLQSTSSEAMYTETSSLHCTTSLDLHRERTDGYIRGMPCSAAGTYVTADLSPCTSLPSAGVEQEHCPEFRRTLNKATLLYYC